MKKIYILTAIGICCTVLIGWVLPWLMSAKNDFAVIIAIVIMLAMCLIPIHFFKSKQKEEK